jgi:hypothetical protein
MFSPSHVYFLGIVPPAGMAGLLSVRGIALQFRSCQRKQPLQGRLKVVGSAKLHPEWAGTM